MTSLRKLTPASRSRPASTVAVDALHEQLFAVLLDPSWPHGVGPAIDAAQLGQWYERYADHAVNAGRRVIYFVIGQPHPARN